MDEVPLPTRAADSAAITADDDPFGGVVPLPTEDMARRRSQVDKVMNEAEVFDSSNQLPTQTILDLAQLEALRDDESAWKPFFSLFGAIMSENMFRTAINSKIAFKEKLELLKLFLIGGPGIDPKGRVAPREDGFGNRQIVNIHMLSEKQIGTVVDGTVERPKLEVAK